MPSLPERGQYRGRHTSSRFRLIPKRARTRAGLAALVATVAVVASVTMAVPASAATSDFGVMNTSETLPDGVWFRNSPRTADTLRITGLGVYRGDRIRVSCFATGDPVGSYGNTVWYQAANLTRPAPVQGHPNSGWINTHYVDDGQRAGNAAPGVPPCTTGGSSPTTPARHVTGIYYSPFGKNSPYAISAPDLQYREFDDWRHKTGCGNDLVAKDYALTPQTLSGWSIGRQGPQFFLAGAPNDDVRRSVKTILLVDPGSREDLNSGCERQGGQQFANWLKVNPDAHLVIYAGDNTEDSGHKSNGRAHAGIQESYFNAIRAKQSGSDLRSRVLVCNYRVRITAKLPWGASSFGGGRGTHSAHEIMLLASKPHVTSPAPTSCPALAGTTSTGSWHP